MNIGDKIYFSNKDQVEHMDSKTNTVTFEEASTDSDIESGDTHSVLFGKIKKRFKTLQENFQAGVDSIYNAIVAQGTTPASKSLSDVTTGISTLSSNRYNNGYNSGKSDYNPTSATLDNAGNLSVKNSSNTQRYSTTFTNNYNAGYNSGYSSGKSDYNPTSATLDNAGNLSVKNSSGTKRYSTTFTNNYNAGYSSGKSDYNPTSATLDNAGNLSVKNSSNTQRYSTTFTNNYNAGYSSGVTDADNRVNKDSTNYKTGYSDGKKSASLNCSILGEYENIYLDAGAYFVITSSGPWNFTGGCYSVYGSTYKVTSYGTLYASGDCEISTFYK